MSGPISNVPDDSSYKDTASYQLAQYREKHRYITKQDLEVINEVLSAMAEDAHKKMDAAIVAVGLVIAAEIGCAIGILKLLGVL